jgi:hypothetical protein
MPSKPHRRNVEHGILVSHPGFFDLLVAQFCRHQILFESWWIGRSLDREDPGGVIAAQQYRIMRTGNGTAPPPSCEGHDLKASARIAILLKLGQVKRQARRRQVLLSVPGQDSTLRSRVHRECLRVRAPGQKSWQRDSQDRPEHPSSIVP